MSLIAWYPLNGDTLDYSGNENHATNYGATIDVNGKIGKCYSFDGIDDGIATPWKPTEFFTLGMWFYKSDWGTDGYENLIGAYSNTFELHTKVSTTNEPYLKLYSWGGATVAYELNRWNHVLLVRTPSGTKLYLNGELKITGSAGSLPNEQYYIGCWRNNTVQNFKGKINDVRFYDHALSQKEIKELAKAKVLHYTFDDFQEPTVNKHNDPTLNKQYTVNQTVAKTAWGVDGTLFARTSDCPVRDKDSLMLEINIISAGSGGLYTDLSRTSRFTLEEGKTYTRSWWIKSNQISKSISGHVCSCNRSSDNYYIVGGNITVTREWQRFSHTFTVGAGYGGDYHTRHIIYNDVFSVWITNIQIEEKPYYTEFTRNSRQGIVKDISGYRNDAVLNLTTTPQWNSDSKIGGGAYKFNGINQWFAIPNSQCKVTDAITVSAWAYRDNWNQATKEIIISCTESGGWQLGFNNTSGQISFLLLANGSYRHAVYPVAGITAGWHLITGTFDGRYVKLYVDGELKSTVDISAVYPVTYNNTNGIFVGAKAGANNLTPFGEYWNGKIDDVRIYATALSQQDIDELCKTRASVDDGGNLYAAQILENTEPTENLIHFQNPRIDASYDPYIPTTSGTWAAKHQDAIKVYNRDGTQITGYINTGVTDWTNTYHAVWTYDESLKKPVVTMRDLDGIWKAKSFGLGKSMDTLGLKAGDKYTISWLQWTDNISRYVNAGLYGLNTSGANEFWDGLSNAQTTCRNTLPKTWQRVYATFTVNANRNMSANLTMFMYGHGSPAATIKISDVQMEKLDHPTPFVDKLRLQSTDIPNNHIYKNAVESNGCLGYENISETGITNGLVAYYPFDKDAKDYSGYGNHGTAIGAIISSGIKKQCYLLDGINDYIGIQSTPVLSNLKSFTFSAWLKLNTEKNWMLVCKGSSNGGFYIYGDQTNYGAFSIYSGAGVRRDVGFGSIGIGTWRHIVGTYDSSGIARTYKDGALVNEATGVVWGNNNNNVNIGCYTASTSYPVNGSIDEVRIYDRPLAAKEITILYDTTRPDKPSVKLTKDMLYLSGELKEGL